MRASAHICMPLCKYAHKCKQICAMARELYTNRCPQICTLHMGARKCTQVGNVRSLAQTYTSAPKRMWMRTIAKTMPQMLADLHKCEQLCGAHIFYKCKETHTHAHKLCTDACTYAQMSTGKHKCKCALMLTDARKCEQMHTHACKCTQFATDPLPNCTGKAIRKSAVDLWLRCKGHVVRKSAIQLQKKFRNLRWIHCPAAKHMGNLKHICNVSVAQLPAGRNLETGNGSVAQLLGQSEITRLAVDLMPTARGKKLRTCNGFVARFPGQRQ